MLILVSLAPAISPSAPFDHRGNQFIAFKSFSVFQKSSGQQGETILTSPQVNARIPWNELIASWNAEMPARAYLRIQARAIYPDHATKWYLMGLWSGDPARHPRESVRRQKDDDGNVATDTLILRRPAERFQLRLTLGGDDKDKAKLKLLSVSLLDSNAERSPLPPNRKAWGKTIDVPEVVTGVYDPKWTGTGNWVFNTAYAGSFKGMRAYTARLSDVAELEDWIARDIPVCLSLCYNRLRGKSRVPSGHLVVLVGFTKDGDPVINDPGTSKNVRKVFPRANLVDAWAHSKNAAYFIYPEKARLPKDRFGHWDSREAVRRFTLSK